jgi:hypothetical protein
MYMSVGSFYTMMFLIDKYLRKELGLTGEVRIATLRSLAVKIVKAISVVEHDNESLLRGVEDVQFKDIEDSCQYQAAVAAGCDLKEARESLYWIELLKRNNYIDERQYQSIYEDCEELVKILVTRCKKLDQELGGK